MMDETNIGKIEPISPSRRAVVTKAAQVVVHRPGRSPTVECEVEDRLRADRRGLHWGLHILDDFTFGNTEEDIDAANFANTTDNFNPLNGQANQDDHV